jgi:hypothetical protein
LERDATMTVSIAEIIVEVRREAERKHNVDDSTARTWPRFSLAKVVPLVDEVERLQAQVDALTAELTQVQA